jgi:rubrerythrin
MSEENSAAESCDVKKLLEYLIKSNKDHRDSIKEDIKALRDEMKNERKAF